MCRWGCVSFMWSLLHGFRLTKHISNSLLKHVKSDHRRGHCCLNNSCSARARVLGVGGANLNGATLKKQSRGPVNLDEPDRPWLAALLWEPLCDWTRVATPLRPNRLLAASCRDTDAHNVSPLLLLWRARADRNGQDARGDSEADKRIKQVRNIELALNRPTSARYIRHFTETHANTHTHTQLLHARATHSTRTHIWLHTWSIVGEHSVFQCKFFSPLWPMCKYEQHGSVSCFSSSLASTEAVR